MMNTGNYYEITPQILQLAELSNKENMIDPELYTRYEVKRGLRDLNGKGVLTGLTNISDVRANKIVNGEQIPIAGELFYRGYNVRDLVRGFTSEERFGFEEVTYLLLFGKLPTQRELEDFCRLLAEYRTLPTSFVRDIIMKAPSRDMMNTLARSVLTLYSYDDNANDISIPNVLRQCLQLISLFPLLSVYGYQAYRHYHDGKSLYIHSPKDRLSTSENILRILRANKTYTPLEARILDVALVLHMEHGGGNNSTFTTHVVSSSGTDTYSVIAAAIGSLKGPRHGGANLKVMQMFDDIKEHCADYNDDEALAEYLVEIMEKRAFDKTGLIYGMGHAVYTLSDPREVLLKKFAERLSVESGFEEEFKLYDRVEKLAGHLIATRRHLFKPICANVDFYSGLVYSILGIPRSLFTPIFAISRISGWSAHRLEELINNGKIIRPAYRYIGEHQPYVPINSR